MSKRKRSHKKWSNQASFVQPKINQTEIERKIQQKSGQCNPAGSVFNEEIFKRFDSDEKYLKRAAEMYEDYYKAHVYREIIDNIYKDLHNYVGSVTPDCYGFQRHLDNIFAKFADKSNVLPRLEHLNPDRRIAEIIDDNASAYLKIPNAVTMLPLIYAHLKNLLKQSELINSRQTTNDLQNRQILQLLTSVLSGKLSFAVEVFIQEVDSENLKYLDDDLNKLSIRALLYRFFMALRKGEKYVCYKIIGVAQNLDPGESDYLEAVAHFYDQDYNTAIRCALRVKDEYPDHSSAVLLLLECYARQGNIVKLVDFISANKTLKYQYLQLVYLYQETILKSECDSLGWFDENDKVISKLVNYIDQSTTNNMVWADYYLKLVKNSVNCVIKIYRNYRNAFYYHTNQNNDVAVVTDIKNCMAIQVISDFYLFKPIKSLLSKINKNVTIITDAWLKNFRLVALKVIEGITGLTQAIPVNNEKNRSLDLFLLGVESIYALDLFACFTQRVNLFAVSLTSYYIRTKDERAADLILRAYTEESIRGNLNGEIKDFVENQLKDKIDNLTLVQKVVAGKLSKNGKIALEAAEVLFSLSKTIDWGWKDAGMISLAYLRIVEVEINQRLILPVVDILDFSSMETEYQKVRKSLAGEKAKWGGIISLLDKIINKKSDLSGLMLYDLQNFFINIGSGIATGDTLACDIRNCISTLMSDATHINALISFIEKDVVSENIRKKYRNPPAHGEYVAYQTACDCREYFYQVMQKLQNALKSSSAENVQPG